MSNQSLVERIQLRLDALRRREATHNDVVKALQREGTALEAIPYAIVRQIDSLAHDFQMAQWALDEECQADTEHLIIQTENLLKKIGALSSSQ